MVSFFCSHKLSILDISGDTLEEIANNTVNQGTTVPGTQKKLSLHLSKDPELRLTVVDYPTGYILKLQTDGYPYMPEYEKMTMDLAKIAGIKVVPNALIKMKSYSDLSARNDSFEYVYITRQIDRVHDDPVGLNKYGYSTRPSIDITELFIRIVFSFLTGNSDMHLKNFLSLRQHPAIGNLYFPPHMTCCRSTWSSLTAEMNWL